MLQNYLVIAWRYFRKNKVFSVINILGLSFGMAVCLLIFQYIAFEVSYDNFHKQSKQICRIVLNNYSNHEFQYASAQAPLPLGKVLKEELPEVQDFARLHEEDEVVITYEENSYLEDKVYYADSSFLTIFSFPLLIGDPDIALSKPNTAVISESMSKKYFGEENPVSKDILVDDGEGGILYTVTGIFKDTPENSHITFDFLLSIHGIVGDDNMQQNWGFIAFFTYLKLSPGADRDFIIEKIHAIRDNYYGDLLKQLNLQHEYGLQSLTDIYLYSDDLVMEPEVRGSTKINYYLTVVAIFILVLAWFNYINLTTAKAIERAREVSLRKINGAFRRHLIAQFLIESVLINLIGVALAITIVQFSNVYFEDLVGKPATYHFLMSSNFGWILIGVFLTGILVSGIYPALLLSQFSPLSILRGELQAVSKGVLIRKGLIIFQLVISFALICGSLIIYSQIRYMINHDLGFNPENIILMHKAEVERAENFDEIEQTFFEELMKHHKIESVTLSFEPGRDYWYTLPVRRQDQPPESSKFIRGCRVDYNFLNTYQIEIIAGRNFKRDSERHLTEIILNEKAVGFFGLGNPDEAIGQTLMIFDTQLPIIGVIKNFHQLKLKYEIQPVLYHLGTPPGYYAIRLNNTENLQETLSFIKTKFDEMIPGNPFVYTTMVDYFNKQYRIEQTFEKIFKIFTILAIIIAGLGLFGLSTFESAQRINEIGVRKVNGARVYHILMLFSKDFIILNMISIVIASPVIYFLMNRWLRNFAFHIEMDELVFIISAILILAVSLLTVNIQVIKAANINPARTLRYE
ncbi:MAG: hypothetical protein AMS27_10160 [Bacteroides sp. SM23_62_1]|nr:MAG: hypothetical protein AMS27_10160 [Bacteroides sp. SM23_62_1]